MSTGVMRLRADSRCSRCRACSSTAMRNASCIMLWPMSDTVGKYVIVRCMIWSFVETEVVMVNATVLGSIHTREN